MVKRPELKATAQISELAWLSQLSKMSQITRPIREGRIGERRPSTIERATRFLCTRTTLLNVQRLMFMTLHCMP